MKVLYSLVAFTVCMVGFVAERAEAAPIPAESSDQNSSQAKPPVAHDDVLQEVVVTAERRSQRLEDVPLSIIAIGQAELDEKKIEGTDDLSRQIPGLQFNRIRLGRFQIAIRGIGGSAEPDIGQNYKVGVFVDDVYIDRPSNMDLAYFDLNHVEVLRGPQGTLYGKNAVAGAINIYTNPPTDKPEFLASLDYGNYNTVQTRLMAGGPLADNLSGKLMIGSNNHDAYSKNDTTGTGLSVQSQYLARGSLRYNPDDWDVLFSTNMERNPNQAGRAYRIVGTTGVQPFGIYGPYYGSTDPYHTADDLDPRSALQIFGTSLRAVHSGSALTFTSISGYNKVNSYFTWDADGTDSKITGVSYNQTETQDARTFSQELRLNSTEHGAATFNDKFFWTAGLFYFQMIGKMTSLDAQYFPDTQVFNVPPGTLLSQYHTMVIQDRNVATYVQATYNLTTDLHFTAGLRYDYERKATTQNATGYAQVVSDNYTDLRASAIWEKATPKATLDYKFIPQLLGYATYSQGFLSGGFNFGPPSVLDNNPFGPEKAINYELGLKSASLGGRLLLNLAVFDVDYTDLQIGVINPTTNLPETQNVGKAISRGIEANVAAQITDKFEADAGFAYSDAHYVRFCDGVSKAQATLTGAACVLAGGIDRNGQALEAYAKTSVRTGFHYEILERGWGKVNLHSDGTYSSSVIYLGGYTQPSYFTMDGGLDFVAADEHYQVGLWGRNLTDKAFVTGCAGLGSTGTGANCTMSDPRRYGISFKVRYR